jgi:hypothetical protein
MLDMLAHFQNHPILPDAELSEKVLLDATIQLRFRLTVSWLSVVRL